MAAHPAISLTDARKMVQYILSFGEEGSVQSLPVKGSFTTTNHQDKGQEGVYILKAIYTDKGGEVAGPASGQQIFALRNLQVKAVDKAGNERIASLLVENRTQGYKNYLIFGIIIGIGILMLYVILWMRKLFSKKNKNTV